MIENIKPGTQINVKVVKQPTNAAAAKTIVRLLSKDAAAKAQNRRLRKIRQDGLLFKQRGGRFDWAVRVVKQQPVQATTGAQGTITATLDVLRDLNSVARFVEVSAA